MLRPRRCAGQGEESCGVLWGRQTRQGRGLWWRQVGVDGCAVCGRKEVWRRVEAWAARYRKGEVDSSAGLKLVWETVFWCGRKV